MKILKYKKIKNNEYKIITNEEEYNLYDDIIIKYELLLKKEISKNELENILKENNMLKAYYSALKYISTKLRTEKEVGDFLKKKEFNTSDIKYVLNRLNKENYLNHEMYIEAYIHDMLNLYLIGEQKILNDLIKLGFKENEVIPYLAKVDKNIYLNKIDKYINKKLKSNKKSAKEFKLKVLNELINKGFNKEDILSILDNVNIEDNPEEIKKLVNKLYFKYSKKYDLNTTKLKIKNYLYQKGYSNIDIDSLIEI